MKQLLFWTIAVIAFLVACSPEAINTSPTGQNSVPGVSATAVGNLRSVLQVAPQLPGKLAVTTPDGIAILQGGAKTLLSAKSAQQPALSPDGTLIAFVVRGDSYADLYFMRLPDGEPQQLTKNKSPLPQGSQGYVLNSVWAFNPCWLDGQRLAYLSDAGTPDLALWQVDLSGRRSRLAMSPPGTRGLGKPSCAPDGSRIVASAFSDDTTQLWLLDLRSGIWKKLTDVPRGAYDPAWSPQGDLIAFAGRNAEMGTDIWLTTAAGAGPQRITDLATARSPAWSPDGQRLAFLVEDRGIFNLWTVALTFNPDGSLTVSRPEQITFNLPIDPNGGVSWSP